MAIKHVLYKISFFCLCVIILASTTIYAQEIEQNGDVEPIFSANSRVLADIDTTHQKLYALLHDEMWRYDLQLEKWDFLRSIDFLSDETKDLEFGFDHKNERILFWSRGVGLVYEFDLTDYSFERIDNSFNHKNQFGHFPFIRNGVLYAFGGYGFWDWHNILTFYNNELREWNLINLNPASQLPIERTPFMGVYTADNDELYIYGGETVTDLFDDHNVERQVLTDFWKYSFESSSWTLLADEFETEFELHIGSSYAIVGNINKGSSSVYSSKSKIWYIPVYNPNSNRKKLYLQPVGLDPFELYDVVEIFEEMNNDKRFTNFFYNPKSESLVLLTFSHLTNVEEYPVKIRTITEESLLAELSVKEDSISVMGAGIAGTAIIFLLCIILLIKKKYISKTEENLDWNSLDHLEAFSWLSDIERKMIIQLIKTDKNVDASALEEMIWPDINNFDYRRKLRNDTINSINKKFSKYLNLNDDLILRLKDPLDNRRYNYFLNSDVLKSDE